MSKPMTEPVRVFPFEFSVGRERLVSVPHHNPALTAWQGKTVSVIYSVERDGDQRYGTSRSPMIGAHPPNQNSGKPWTQSWGRGRRTRWSPDSGPNSFFTHLR